MSQILQREIRLFLTALTFYTRIPAPKSFIFDAGLMSESIKYLPFLGVLVGIVAALVMWLTALVLPVTIAVLISMMISILITGAFHEDGLADACDGLGGGWEKSQVLTIMKDSRIGSYGVISLVLVLLLKFELISGLAEQQMYLVWVALPAAHGLSRLAAVLIAQFTNYISLSAGQSKSAQAVAERLNIRQLILASALVLPALLLLPVSSALLAILSAGVLGGVMRTWFIRRIGGYTGDCLGAVQQLVEVACYLAIAASLF